MHKDKLMDEPFDFEGFNQVKDIYGDDAAWDALFALGFGSDEWENIGPTVTTRQLEDAAKIKATENGTEASRVDTRVPTAAPDPSVTSDEDMRAKVASGNEDKPVSISAEDRVARSRLIRSSQQG